ncbi:hypothetical protein FHG87_003491 [Trinorchestia longiramus]|nr:hypothetical protein FHG87_003491 [Trinorchestia longiramus]
MQRSWDVSVGGELSFCNAVRAAVQGGVVVLRLRKILNEAVLNSKPELQASAMEVFRESVARIFKEGSAETMIKFLEHCWLHRTPDVAKPLSAAYTAGRCAAEQAVSEALPWLDGGPCDMPEWDPLVLWVCPTRCLLDAIAHQVRGAGLCSVTSLGSGTGLLEWLLAECSGLEVTSLEVNRSWWESSYAPPTFVKHVYTDEIHGDDDEQHGSTEVYEIPPTDAFMTCYFNNADVFRYF